tara:strand:- start:100 stop:1044 length:945 start_codon:yes stop_codon:yes gene_type:complete
VSNFRIEKSRIGGQFLSVILVSVVFWYTEPLSAQGHSPAINDSVLFYGQVLFARNCSVGYCHGKGGRAGRGPRLRGKEFSSDYLREVIEKGIPNSAMRSWGDRLARDEIHSIVSFIKALSNLQQNDPDPVFGGGRFTSVNGPTVGRVDQVESILSAPSEIVGDVERGRALFFDAGDRYNCAHCHTIDGRGTKIGPDLGRLNSAPYQMLIRDILLPNVFVVPEGRIVEMVTTRGDSMEVIRLGETETRVKVFDITTLPPVKRNIKKATIQSEVLGHRSGMPDIYASHYTVQDLLDVVSFIKSGTGAAPAVIDDLF